MTATLLLQILYKKSDLLYVCVCVAIDGALSLLFKALTAYVQSPTSPLSEELQTELSGNIPEEKHPNLLTLTRAAHLQGEIKTAQHQ